jgi:hypothetical protein
MNEERKTLDVGQVFNLSFSFIRNLESCANLDV